MRYFYLAAPSAVVRADSSSFTYHSPKRLPVGALVRVSVGRNFKNAVIISEVRIKPHFKTKPIESLLASKPLPIPLIELARWLSTYYCTHFALVLQTVLPAGLHRKRRQVTASNAAVPTRKKLDFKLSKEQTEALSVIKSSPYTTLLLHGVTGSGKTQVYIEAAKEQAELGKSTIVLVPEIALTPQLLAEFAHHFKHLILTHSGMTEAKRHQAWLDALNSHEPCVVIGPRSALFMPVAKLGLVVVDECHEPSYKQEQSPRYSALRAATVLAKMHGAKVILGSATPSVSDYYLGLQNKGSIIELKHPVVATHKVQVEIVDLKDQSKFKRHHFLSNPLLSNIDTAINKGHQTLLFHNRRGSSPTVLCSHCGWLALCPNCNLPLTFHADQHQLRCHLCGLNQIAPVSCPACHEPTVTFRGIGTKQIEAEITKLFPKASVARFDADTEVEAALHNRYQELYEGKIDIIIGTQMLAKGFDLPRLTTVGIIQADSGLFLPDYQAEERVFQLISQVMGRVGRQQQPGQVTIQTYQPTHSVIQNAIAKDYKNFYQAEITKRERYVFPPFCYLLKLTCVYKTERGAIEASRRLASELRMRYPNLEILGPTPAFYERLGQSYRWQLVVKSDKRSDLIEIAGSITTPWQFDLDATNLL